MTLLQKLSKVNLSVWVLVGALLGILCGVTFGESAAVLEPIGSIYVMLLQMCVFPFVVSSLLHGLGSLTPAMAGRLLRSALPIFLLGWFVLFVALWMLSQAIPAARPPVVVRPAEGGGLAELLSLVIPSNPFSDLTQNYVPAIVVFCIFYGVAMQGVQKKDSLLESLAVFRMASVTVWGWVVRIAPFGVFALFAALAGTVQIELLGGLLLYSVLFVAGALVIALWVLPSLICALVPVRYPNLMKDLREALVVAVVTSLPISAVPFIIRVTLEMVKDNEVVDDESEDIVSTTLAVSYPVGQMGNLFVIFFVVFAAFYANSALPGTAWLSMPLVTILSTVGTPVSTVDAVDFMAQWLSLPSNVETLYVDLMTLTRYPQVLVSAMSLAFVTILVTFSYYRIWRISIPRIVASLGVSLILIGGLAVAGKYAAPHLVAQHADPYRFFALQDGLAEGVHVTVHKEAAEPASAAAGAAPGGTLARIQSSGTLRVGYGPETIPFSYVNQDGDLVGYDVAMVYQLAQDLDVALEFYPITDWETLDSALQNNRYDLAIGGIYVTDRRLQETAVSQTYFSSPLALISNASAAHDYLDLQRFAGRSDLNVAVIRSDVLEPIAKKLFPEASIDVVTDYDALRRDGAFDLAVWTLEQGKAWAEANPGYSAVVPDNLGAPLSIAFLMPPNAGAFRRYLDDWIDLKKTSGFDAGNAAYWLEGQPATPQTPRWSIWQNVLGFQG